MKQESVDKLLTVIREVRLNRFATEWSGFKKTGQIHKDIAETTCRGEISILSIRPESHEAFLDCTLCQKSIRYKYQPIQNPQDPSAS